MPSTKTTVTVRKNRGKFAEIDLHLKWDTTLIDAKRQQQIWEGIGITLAAAMDPAERAEFLDEFRKQTTGRAKKRRRRHTPEETFSE